MTRTSASAALHSLPGDCAARDAAARGSLSCDASALLRALRGADAPLPAALAWLRARARAGALAALPAALAALDGVSESAAAAAPAHAAPPRGRLRLGALPPPAPAALLHALRLEARLFGLQRRRWQVLQSGRADASRAPQARLFPRAALLRLAAAVLAEPEAALDASARSAARLLVFDVGGDCGDAPAPPRDAPLAPQPSQPVGKPPAAPPEEQQPQEVLPGAPPPEEVAAAAAAGAALAALAPLAPAAEGGRAAAALLSALAAAATDKAALASLRAAHLDAAPDGAAAAVAVALRDGAAAAALGFARCAALLSALLLQRLRSLSAPAPRPLAEALAAAAEAAPSALAAAVAVPLLAGPPEPRGQHGEALARVFAGPAGPRLAPPLLAALCVPGAITWTEAAVAAAAAALALRLPLGRDALTATCAALEAAAAELPASIKLSRLLLAIVAHYGPQLEVAHVASLRRAAAATRTFMTRGTLAKLDAL